MNTGLSFDQAFRELTGNLPFPWQVELFERFLDSPDAVPRSCSLPTGVGKTSIIAIWLLALAARVNGIPRRLVYVVNRRTVVDQTTTEVERLRERIDAAGIAESLRGLCAIPLTDDASPLAISTLRGQFADNREWSADPARPAVIVGTVDMIGSRLLFAGYGLGFRSRPLHAAFLAQDVLLVHDEAHLEPAFQALIEAIENEQHKCKHSVGVPWPKLRVISLSATTRTKDADTDHPFALTPAERNVPVEIPNPPTEPIHVVWRRVAARKLLHLHFVDDEKRELADKLAEVALEEKFKSSGKTILIFARTVENVEKIAKKLSRQPVQQLTGTLRGHERDRLPNDPVFCRFLPESNRPAAVTPRSGTVYLICTAAGEVGVNISADHLICDLTTFESMAQRFGRANRFGDCEDTEIHVVGPAEFEDSEYENRRQLTLGLLRELQGDASPLALSRLDWERRDQAFAPLPEIIPTTDVLLDAWSLTTVREKLPGRPPVEPYLHGIAAWEPPETFVAWRWEVERVTGDLLAIHKPEDLLEEYPLKPHELLREPSARALRHFQKLAKKHATEPVWLLDDQGSVKVLTLEQLTDGNNKDQLYYRTVLLPPRVGGLTNGMLNGSSDAADDVADEWYADAARKIHRRMRVWDDESVPEGMRLLRAVDMNPDADEEVQEEAETKGRRVWFWYTLPKASDDDLSRSAQVPVVLQDHLDDVTRNVQRIVAALDLPEQLSKPLIVAAKLHDFGKRRTLWQRSIGNPCPRDWHAKSGRGWRPVDITDYRHEFGSLLDLRHSNNAVCVEFERLNENGKQLVLHLIAAHHGRARPHFPANEQFDPEYLQEQSDAVAIDVPLRFARLQRKYGRWGLAYLESLLRAADWAASAAPSTEQCHAPELATEVSQ